ncbi:hypothetical protein ACFVRD_44740 [Streptomyces sp. NPDC057908]|uniref:hypothetical protein n=1 Tax=Streptomyces sp. NPDC057908 TaxID=3346276 RepID=UPI0036E636AF
MDLVAPGVVSIMPEATLNAAAEHASGRQYPRYLWRSAQKLEELAAFGVDYADVVQVLEDEGVDKFDAGWHESVEKLAVSPHESDSGRPHGTDRSREKV